MSGPTSSPASAATRTSYGTFSPRLSGDAGFRKVRITGTHGPRLEFEYVDAVGYGLVMPQQVHEGDRGKLGNILERMAQDGSVKA